MEGLMEVKGPALRIGVDIGGVLSSKVKEYENDTNRMDIGFDMADWLDAVRTLRFKGHRLFIVSFCGEHRAKQTHKLFHTKCTEDGTLYKDLFEDAFFVKKRPYKHDVAVYLGLDVMIDDRLDILKVMTSVHRFHFVGDLPKDQIEKDMLDRKTKRTTVQSWRDVVQRIDLCYPRGNRPNDRVDVKSLCYCRF